MKASASQKNSRLPNVEIDPKTKYQRERTKEDKSASGRYRPKKKKEKKAFGLFGGLGY